MAHRKHHRKHRTNKKSSKSQFNNNIINTAVGKTVSITKSTSKKYMPKSSNNSSRMKGTKDITDILKDAPVSVAATDAHSSLETTSIFPDADAAAGAQTDAQTDEDVSGPAAANSNQHENAITLSLTE